MSDSVWNICLPCGMSPVWNVSGVEYIPCGMSPMWDVFRVKCLPCGMLRSGGGAHFLSLLGGQSFCPVQAWGEYQSTFSESTGSNVNRMHIHFTKISRIVPDHTPGTVAHFRVTYSVITTVLDETEAPPLLLVSPLLRIRNGVTLMDGAFFLVKQI